MTRERALRYVDQLEAHMDEGGKTAPNNLRDLIQMIRELAAPEPSGWAQGAEAMRALCVQICNGVADGSLKGPDEFCAEHVCVSLIRAIPIPAPKAALAEDIKE